MNGWGRTGPLDSVPQTPDFPEGRHVRSSRCFQPCPFSTRNHTSRFTPRPCNPRPQGKKGQTAPVLQRIAPWRHMTISFTPEKGKSYGWLLSLLQVGTSTHHHLLFLFLNWIFYFSCIYFNFDCCVLITVQGLFLILAHGLSCPETCGISLPWPGIKPAFPVLEGKFWTTGPPVKSCFLFYFLHPLWASPAGKAGFAHAQGLCGVCMPHSSSTSEMSFGEHKTMLSNSLPGDWLLGGHCTPRCAFCGTQSWLLSNKMRCWFN